MDLSTDGYASDAEALRALKQKQSPALRALLSKYESALIAYLITITRDAALAEDLAQDTFLKLIRRPPFRVRNGSLKPWLFKVARNLAIDQLRSRQRVELRESLPEPQNNHAHRHKETLVASDTHDLLQALPQDMRQIVALRIYADFTYKEISQQLKLPLGTVLWKMTKALKQLRSTLEAEDQ